MVGKPLTAKQEAFAQAVADGMTQSDAYRKAYNAEKMSDKQVWEQGSIVAKNSKVAQRVTDLNAKLEAKAMWRREDSVSVLQQVITLGLNPRSHAKASDAVSAVTALNKMHGYDAPVQVEHTGHVGYTLRILRGDARD